MPPRRRFRLLCAATFFHFLAMGVFISGLPLFVSRELDGSKAAVGLAVGAFSISAVFSRPFVGRQVDRVGRRPFLLGAPALIAVTAAGLVAAAALLHVVLLRLVQGLAGSSYYTSAATAATDLSPADRRADYISRFSLFLYAGFAVGPGVGEWVINEAGYTWAWLTAAASALLAAGILAALPDTRPPADPERVPPPRRIAHPAALGPGLVLATIAVGYTSIQAFSPLYAERTGLGAAGGLYATFAVSILLVRLVSGRMADRFGRVRVAFPGLLCGITGMALLALFPYPLPTYAGVAFFAAGHALAFPALMALTVDRVPDSERGEALGSFTACFDAGAAAGGYLVGWIADQAGFAWAWATPGAMCAVGAGVLLLIRRTEALRRERAAEAPPLEPAGA